MNRALPAAALTALVAALLATWPAPVRPDLVLGLWNHPDMMSNHWLLVWVVDRFLSGGDLLDNELYYWPYGDQPLLAGNGADGFLYIPFHLLFGWPYGVTFYALFTMIVQGAATGVTASRLGGGVTAAIVAAAAFTANPYVVQEMGSGRFSQSDAAFVATALGGAVVFLHDARAGRPVRDRDAVFVGAAWGIGASLYWYYGYFVVICALPILGVHLASRAGVPWRAIGIAGAVGTAILAYPLSWFMAHWGKIPGTGEETFPHREAWGDSLGWVFPIDVNGPHQGIAMALPVLVLAAWPLITRRDRWTLVTLVVLGLFGAALAAGPELFWTWPDPYALFYRWTASLRRFWWPSRHMLIVHWVVAVLAGLGAEQVVARWPRAKWPATVALAASIPLALIAQSDLWQVPLSRWNPPPFYQKLGAMDAGVLAELPISPRLAGTQQTLAYQLVHHQKLMGGHALWVDRVRPAAWDARLVENSFFAALVAFEEGRADRIRFDGPALVAARDEGLRWITANPEYAPRGLPDAYARALAPILGAPIVEEGGARLWDLQRWTGVTDSGPVGWRLPPGAMLANGVMPMVARRPASLGFAVERMPRKPFQGLHPSVATQPARP